MATKADLAKKLRDMRPVNSLILLPDNPRHGDIGAISQSLERFGQQKPIVINSEGVILAGNHTFQAAKALGWDEIWVAESELAGTDQPGFALADNRLSDLATYDHDILIQQLKEQPDLVGTGYDGDDLDDLLDEARRREPDLDETLTNPPPAPVTNLGDVWHLGDHVLLCADSFLIDLDTWPTVDVVIADPPYGIELDTAYTTVHHHSTRGETKDYRPVIGDDRPFDPTPLLEAWSGVEEQFWFGGDYYRDHLRGGSWLVWDKRVEESLDAVIGSGFELIWMKQRHKRRILRVKWSGSIGMVGPDSDRRVHPTQKPVRLIEDLLYEFTAPGHLVADPFAGSGSTLIACQRAGRRSWNVEIDPAYCDVIVERFRTAFPDQPVRRPDT